MHYYQSLQDQGIFPQKTHQNYHCQKVARTPIYEVKL